MVEIAITAWNLARPKSQLGRREIRDQPRRRVRGEAWDNQRVGDTGYRTYLDCCHVVKDPTTVREPGQIARQDSIQFRTC